MNHRSSVRIAVHLTVDVFKREQFLGRYTTRNMDVEGVFIEMRTTDLDANDLVELLFVTCDCGYCNYALTAGVARLDTDGAGMMLFDHDHRALDILRTAIQL